MPKESEQRERERTADEETTNAILDKIDTLPDHVILRIGHHAVSQAKDRVRGSIDSVWSRYNKTQNKEVSCHTCGHSLVSPLAALRNRKRHQQGKKLQKEGRELVNLMHAGVDKPLNKKHSVHRIPSETGELRYQRLFPASFADD